MKVLLLATVLTMLISCKKSSGDNPPAIIPAQTYTNVAYGNDAKQKMDVYLPAGRSATETKVIILIHGGGWTEGDKADFSSFVPELQQRLPDYAIININYRLATGTANFFPTQENDVKAAVEFIRSKASEYKISDKIVLLGASAGAHLALLQGYKYQSTLPVKAIISFFGPTDMIDMYNNPANPLVPQLLQAVLGGTPITKTSLYQESSPLNYVTNLSSPTMILHGGLDPLVALNQSTMLKNKLTQAGVINEMVVYPTEGHGWIGANMQDSFNRIEVFLDANVN